MNQGDARTFVYSQLPQATQTTVTSTFINNMLREGCDKVNERSRFFWKTLSYSIPGNTPASSQAPIEFSLSTIFPGYLGMKKVGFWFYDQYGYSQWMLPKTKKYLDIYFRNWRDNQGSSVPRWMYTEDDTLGLYPYVNVAGTYITADCLIKAPLPSTDSNYYWSNSSQEITTFTPLDNAIKAYAVWKCSPAVFDKEGRNYNQQYFEQEVKMGMVAIKNNAMMTSDYEYYMNIGVNRGFLPR